MELRTNNKEQMILEVAEKLFIEKGYAGTKTTDIAEIAGVNHALLHYYFRTKENLFNQIFEQKVLQILDSLKIIVDNEISSFSEKLKNGIEMHFDFLNKNPELPLFILQEIVMNKDRKAFIRKNIFPHAKQMLQQFDGVIRKEVQKGTIRMIRASDLVLNIASLNVFAFVIAQVLFDMDSEDDRENIRFFLESRKKNNVEMIMNSLKKVES